MPSGVDTIQRKRATYSTLGQADATAQLQTESPRPGNQWAVGRMTVAVTPATGSQVSVYINEIAPQNLVDFTQRGDSDIADEFTPILVGPQEILIFVWGGVQLGVLCTAQIQFDIETPGEF